MVWKKVILLLLLVYDCCKKLFLEENWNFILQMKNVAFYLPNNITGLIQANEQ